MGLIIKNVWSKEVLERNDSPVSSSTHLGSFDDDFEKVIFISDTEICLQYWHSADIFSLNEKYIEHRLVFDVLSQFLQFDEDTLIFLESKKMSFWSIPFGMYVGQWKAFPGAGASSTRLGVSNSENGKQLFLVLKKQIFVVRVFEKYRKRLKLKPKIVKRQEIPDWDDENDNDVREISVCRNKIAIRTASRIIVFDVSSNHILFQFPHERGQLDETGLNDEYLAYVDGVAGELVVRGIRTGEIFYKSTSVYKLQTCPNQSIAALGFPTVRYAVQRSVLMTKFTFVNKSENCHIVIYSSLETGTVYFKQTFSGKFYGFTPQLHRKGLLLPESKDVNIKTVPDAIFQLAFLPIAKMDLTSWTIEELEGFHLTEKSVEALKRKHAAVLVAAFVCRFMPENIEAFTELSNALSECFENQNLDGLALSNRLVVSVSDLVNMIMDYFKNHHNALSEEVALRERTEAFINKLNGRRS